MGVLFLTGVGDWKVTWGVLGGTGVETVGTGGAGEFSLWGSVWRLDCGIVSLAGGKGSGPEG